MAAKCFEELLLDLVGIDSTNPDLVPGGAGERAIADFIVGWASHHGLSAEVVEAKPGRPNVVITCAGSGDGPTLLLNAHTDTVGGSGRPATEPRPYVRDGRLYGRGALDTKGGLAAFMLAMKTIGSLSLSGSVIMTAVVDEEFASIGTESLLDRIRADAAIVTEPSGLQLTTSHRGFVWLEVVVTGFAAHGSLWDRGVDAIARAGHVLVGVDRLARRLIEAPHHPMLGPGSIHASTISGGSELSSYPGTCVIGIERRTLPGEEEADAVAELQEIIDRIRGDQPDFDATVRATFSREPLLVGEDADIMQVVRRAATAVLGHPPELAGGTGWMDAALLAGSGIPTIVFGPSGEGLHGDVEWVDLDSVEHVHDVVVAAAGEFCG